MTTLQQAVKAVAQLKQRTQPADPPMLRIVRIYPDGRREEDPPQLAPRGSWSGLQTIVLRYVEDWRNGGGIVDP